MIAKAKGDHLDQLLARAGRFRTAHLVEGPATQLRPRSMTFATMTIGLIPTLCSTGPGSEIMKRVAAPIVGKIVISFIFVLLVYPAVSAAWGNGLWI